MKKILYILLIFFSFTSSLFSQNTWWKMYNGGRSPSLNRNFYDEGYDVCKFTDGNFCIVGLSEDTAGASKLFILKVKPNGDTLWTKRIGYAVADSALRGFSCISCDNNTCLIGGENFNNKPFILKIDGNGNIIWQKYYIYPGVTSGIFHFEKTSDGGYITSGSYYYIMKLDSNCNYVWSRTAQSVGYTSIFSITETFDGNFISVGEIFSPPVYQVKLTKWDNDGVIIWEKPYAVYRTYPALIKKLTNGNFILFGEGYDINNKQGVFFSKINISGDVFNTKIIVNDTLGSKIEYWNGAANIINDNRYVFGTLAQSNIGEDSIRHCIFNVYDSLGTTIKRNSVTNYKKGFYNPRSAVPMSDGSLMFAGYGQFLRGLQDNDVFAARTDSNLFIKPVGIQQVSENIAHEFNLYQNYPNPFNPSTIINYEIIKSSFVEIKVFDISGKLIKILENSYKHSGNYQIEFTSENLSTGIYYYSLYLDNLLEETKKAVILK